MEIKNLRPLLHLAVISLVFYILHHGFFYFFKINTNAFQHSLETVYLVFWIMASILLTILIKIKHRSFDNVGMSFLLGTMIEIIVTYFLLRPILQNKAVDSPAEKVSFFITFILFLLFQTILTIRLLNQKR